MSTVKDYGEPWKLSQNEGEKSLIFDNELMTYIAADFKFYIPDAVMTHIVNTLNDAERAKKAVGKVGQIELRGQPWHVAQNEVRTASGENIVFRFAGKPMDKDIGIMLACVNALAGRDPAKLSALVEAVKAGLADGFYDEDEDHAIAKAVCAFEGTEYKEPEYEMGDRIPMTPEEEEAAMADFMVWLDKEQGWSRDKKIAALVDAVKEAIRTLEATAVDDADIFNDAMDVSNSLRDALAAFEGAAPDADSAQEGGAR